MKYLRYLGLLFVWFCVGTVLAQAVLVGMLWWKGAFSDDRVMAMYAALHGIERPSAASKIVTVADTNTEQKSLDELAQQRMLRSLDLELRENTLDKGLADLKNLEAQIRTDEARLNDWKESYDLRLARLETTALETSLLELQKTLEAIQPKQAKEQILKMIDDAPDGRNEQAMQDVVKILKAMPMDKRRKILGEFKSEDEAKTLAEILKEIRLGSPDVDLIRDSRAQLQQELNPQR